VSEQRCWTATLYSARYAWLRIASPKQQRCDAQADHQKGELSPLAKIGLGYRFYAGSPSGSRTLRTMA
jgi:hypothetical protein